MAENEFLDRTKAVNGCLSMLLLSIFLATLPYFLESRDALIRKGLFYPLIYLTQFLVIFTLYLLFFRKREGLGKGEMKGRYFAVFIFCIFVIQFVLPRALGLTKSEDWLTGQMSLPGWTLLFNAMLLTFVVPVYEEIIFRGCLFNALMYWFNDRVYWSSLVLAATFSLLHTQYTDPRTFFLLFLVSLVLTAARVKTKGLGLPIALHMIMNGSVSVLSYLFITVSGK